MTAITTPHIRDLLRQKHAGQDWHLSFEVGDSTGAQQRRHADAVAMNTWPSRGFVIQGYEIKVTRSDWKRELDNPQKADAVMQHCDYWWLVCPNGVAEEHEVPPSWGILIATEQRLRTARPAVRLREPGCAPMSRGFVAALLKRRSAEDASFQEAVKVAVSAERERIKREDRFRTVLRDKDAEQAKLFRDLLEKKLGLPLPIYYVNAVDAGATAEKIKAAVALVKYMEHNQIDGLLKACHRLTEHVEQFKREFEEAMKES